MTEKNYTPEQIKDESLRWLELKKEVAKVIVGQEHIVERVIIGLLCKGHVLLEGIPGLAKTTIIKTLSRALGLGFSRIQFTPDLLPSDLIGTLIYNPKTAEFQTKRGPIFSNLILADEINRAPAKVQSALLEAMQEHQVTLGDSTYKLEEPFLVLATQNPIDQEGTYRLPEAQLDRFLFKLSLTYPSLDEEKVILTKSKELTTIGTIATHSDISEAISMVESIYTDPKIIHYIVQIVQKTRPNETGSDFDSTIHPYIAFGASPRASLALYNATKGYAFLKRRHFVIPEDVKAIAHDILSHRIIRSYEAERAEITTTQIIDRILKTIPTP